MTPRPMLRLLLAALCLGAAAWPAFAEPVREERARIKAERAEVEGTWAARERECSTRFSVTSCVDDARRVRRAALADLRRQEAVLDESERRERAAARLASLDAKARQRPVPSPKLREAKTPPTPDARAPHAENDAADVELPAASAAAGPRARALPRPAAPADRRAQEAASAAEFEARAEAARAHRTAVERRNAERAAKGKQGQPLPLPGGASTH